MRLPVVLIERRLCAPDNHSISALVEHLSDTGHHAGSVPCPEEARTDIAGCKVARSASQPPETTACLVVQSREEVPGSSGLVLKALRSWLAAALPLLRSWDSGIVGTLSDHLDRTSELEG